MKTTAKVYVHPRGDAERHVQTTADGKVLAGVDVGPVTIQSTDPDLLEQVASELLAAVSAQRADLAERADREAVSA